MPACGKESIWYKMKYHIENSTDVINGWTLNGIMKTCNPQCYTCTKRAILKDALEVYLNLIDKRVLLRDLTDIVKNINVPKRA